MADFIDSDERSAMQRILLKSKIHRATVTESDLNYEGSLTIDKALMAEVGLCPFERVSVYNINNGKRFDTYAIEGPADSGIIGLNGAAARKGLVGDLVIIVSYAFFNDEELQDFKPKIVLLDERNRIKQQLPV